MLISTKGRYALRVMVALGCKKEKEYTRLDEIASEQEISEKYLEGIVSCLTKEKLIEGLRGRGGGYRLTKKIEEYSLWEILCCVEENMATVACLHDKEQPCKRAKKCKTLPVWKNLDMVIKNYLKSVSLSDVIKQGEI